MKGYHEHGDGSSRDGWREVGIVLAIIVSMAAVPALLVLLYLTG